MQDDLRPPIRRREAPDLDRRPVPAGRRAPAFTARTFELNSTANEKLPTLRGRS
jgi:hypothetical protein